MAKRRKSQNNIEKDIAEYAAKADAGLDVDSEELSNELDDAAAASDDIEDIKDGLSDDVYAESDAEASTDDERSDDSDNADDESDYGDLEAADSLRDVDSHDEISDDEASTDVEKSDEDYYGDESDYDEDAYYDDESGYEDEAYYEDESEYDDVEDYFDDKPQKKKKSSQLDILDDDYIKENMMHKSGGKTVALIIAWIVFVALCISYVYVFFIRKDKEEKVPGKDNSVVLEIPDGANYRRCEIAEINQLINNYLLAKVKCNQETLKTLVTDSSQFDDMTVLEQAAEYIIGYDETTCYIADGYDENGYIVIELSYLKISNVQSEPLDIMSFYVVKDEDGKYKIDNSVLSPEVSDYVSEVKATQNIQDIYIHVKENNDYLLNTDTTFADFYNLISE